MSAPVTFEDFAALPGVGVAWCVDVSLDNFATHFKNYSTVALQLVDGGTMYDPRIASLGNLSRALGPDRGFTASTFSLELENLDGGCDWLADRTTFATQGLRAKFLLRAVAYNQNNFTERVVKELGYYMLIDPPTRRNGAISLSLVDDALGDVATLAETPTVRDWGLITDANRPAWLTEVVLCEGSLSAFDIDAPTALMFGNSLQPLSYVGRNCYIVCAVAGSAGSLPLGIDLTTFGNGYVLPLTVQSRESGTWQDVVTYRRTPDITKGGRVWHLLWADINLTGKVSENYWEDDVTGIAPVIRAAGYDDDGGAVFDGYKVHGVVGPLRVRGWLHSHPVDDVSLSNPIHAATIVEDLLAYYARRENAPVYSASFDAVRAARPGASASGLVEQGASLSTTDGGKSFREAVDGSLIQAIRGICAVGAFDVFCDWSGNIQAAAFASDFNAQTATFPTLDETLVKGDVTEHIAGVGERNAPYNRTYVMVGSVRYGPLDDAVAIASWGKIVARQFDGDWLPLPVAPQPAEGLPLQIGATVSQRPILSKTQFASLGGSTIRPIVTVQTWLNGLNYELGDYLYFSWQRGGLGGPYVNSTFRVEGISLDPMSCTVELTLVWVDDLRSSENLPYLLDDEDLNLRASGSGGRTATVTAGSPTVTFSSGNLTSDGVLPNDNFVIHDAAEAIDAFARNQQYRVATVDSATQLTLTGNVGGSGSHALAVWELLAGALTYRANATYFGKTVDSNGFFSDGTTVGNKLLEG